MSDLQTYLNGRWYWWKTYALRAAFIVALLASGFAIGSVVYWIAIITV